eukprot:CAMPEP_0183745648 /NCGR_PEP_ID=MMETSP0737-20130205/66353_1 /TAXON_ID=385413 /ORGANISM="Thalassiosira miniscula, Strain CCMP1093" /LENGTH=548 /DNA_ID=CAMNT_0025981325 /DNA_START=20 /DNA_END=1667 /DNA_ORIENTATION=-
MSIVPKRRLQLQPSSNSSINHNLHSLLFASRSRRLTTITTTRTINSNHHLLSIRHPRVSRSTTFTTKSYSSAGRRSSSSSGTTTSGGRRAAPKTIGEIWTELRKTPLQYATIPAVAAFLGLYTNWMGVKKNVVLSEEYMGTEWYREEFVPYGFLGWQGVVPCKTEKMAMRLVHIVTEKLLTVEEAFGHINPNTLASLLQPIVEQELEREPYGELLVKLLRPVLPYILSHVVTNLQKEIDDVLDLKSVVLEAFVRDKVVLVELFQKVGRVELDFLVESGLGFGFILGLGQMIAWVIKPKPWTLPVAGAIVGYITNWIAIKLLFSPVEPVKVGPIVVQGLFQSRQVEVSDEFANFMAKRVLNSGRLLESLARDAEDGELYSFLRRQLPYPVPEFVVLGAVRAIGRAANPREHRELHNYMTKKLDVEQTLAYRLKLLSATEFEDLLHPVFQEDEIILIAAGGVLGAIAGLGQTRLGWGGPGATIKAAITVLAVSLSSWGYFLFKEVIEEPEELIVEVENIVKRPVKLRRRNTLIQVKTEVIPDWLQIPEFR